VDAPAGIPYRGGNRRDIMEALALVVAVLGIIYFVFRFPLFRRWLLVVVGVGILGVAVIAIYRYQEDKKAKEEEQRREVERREEELREIQESLKRISPEELDLSRLKLRQIYQLASGTTFVIGGRIKNNSPEYYLIKLRLLVTIQDCSSPENCETIGNRGINIKTRIPSGQARDVREEFKFEDIKERKGLQRDYYQVTQIRGSLW